MKKLIQFNRSERMGAAALIIIGFIALIMPEIQRWLAPKKSTDFSSFELDVDKFRLEMNGDQMTKGAADANALKASELFFFNPNTANAEDFIRLGLSEKTATSICNYRNKGGKFRKPLDFKKIYTLSDADYNRLSPYIDLGLAHNTDRVEGNDHRSDGQKIIDAKRSPPLFAFDPNTVTESELLQLGLSKWLAGRILNYRSKGGKFRNKEDLEKIYGFPEEDYLRLESYISIAATEPLTNGKTDQHTYSRKNSALMSPIDINRADVEHWQLLPGIGEKRAQMIVNYREKLGGFLSLEQVAETRGLPDSTYQQIRSMLVLDATTTQQINLNTATTEQLNAHPYISFKQASLIVADRSQNGKYQKVEDLLRIPAFVDKVWLARVKPYLSAQ